MTVLSTDVKERHLQSQFDTHLWCHNPSDLILSCHYLENLKIQSSKNAV